MKSFSLVLTVIIVAISLVFGCVTEYSLYSGCPWYNHFSYLLVHGNIFHALINVYCLLTLAFLCDLRWWQFLSALAIASSCVFPTEVPVVGLSTLIYAATGIIVMQSKKWWWFIIINLLIIGAGAALNGIAFLEHLTCFGCGLGVGFLFDRRYEG